MKIGSIKKLSLFLGILIGSLVCASKSEAYYFKLPNTPYNIVGEIDIVYLQAGVYADFWAVPDSGGFRLQQKFTNDCLNTGLYASAGGGIKVGAPVNLYQCTPGDAGQVFQNTPNPGQLKFKTQGGAYCIKPKNFGPAYGSSPLIVGACSNSPAFQQLGNP